MFLRRMYLRCICPGTLDFLTTLSVFLASSQQLRILWSLLSGDNHDLWICNTMLVKNCWKCCNWCLLFSSNTDQLSPFPVPLCRWCLYLECWVEWAGSPMSSSDLSSLRWFRFCLRDGVIVMGLVSSQIPCIKGLDKRCNFETLHHSINSNHLSWQIPPQLVPDNELGKVFGAVAVCGDLANMAGTLLANSLYSPLRF